MQKDPRQVLRGKVSRHNRSSTAESFPPPVGSLNDVSAGNQKTSLRRFSELQTKRRKRRGEVEKIFRLEP